MDGVKERNREGRTTVLTAPTMCWLPGHYFWLGSWHVWH
jgi:hypothetical protein